MDIEFKGLYNKRHTGKVQISSVSGIFGFNLHCDVYFCVSAAISFTMREVSQADERRKKDSGQNLAYAVLRHLCGLYVYAYNDSVLFKGSREAEPASPIWCCGAIGGMTLQMHAYFDRKYSIVYTIWAYIFHWFLKSLDEMVYNTCWCFYKRSN